MPARKQSKSTQRSSKTLARKIPAVKATKKATKKAATKRPTKSARKAPSATSARKSTSRKSSSVATPSITGETQAGTPLWLVDFLQRAMPPQAERSPESQAAMEQAIAEHLMADSYFPGEVGVETTTEQDQAYLAHMADEFFLQTGKDIRFAGVLGGRTPHLNAARSNGEANRNRFDFTNYDSPLKQAIARRIAQGRSET